MNAAEFLLVIMVSPIAALVGGYLGRIAQRKYWLLDRPYSERIADLRASGK